MTLAPITIQRWALIVLVVFIAARFSGAHVHLCTDGYEAPVTVHLSDGSVHNDAHHAAEGSADIDVDVLDATVKKPNTESQLLYAIVAYVITLSVGSTQRHARPLARDWTAFYQPFRLRPPLRGPPL